MSMSLRLHPIRWLQSPKSWIFAAIGVAILAMLAVACLLLVFYIDTASYAPNTEIRPMVLAADLALSGLTSIILGGGLALVGTLLSLTQRRWRLAAIAALMIVLTSVPLVVGFKGFHFIVHIRRLVLAD